MIKYRRNICTFFICFVSFTIAKKDWLSNNLNLIAAKNAILQIVLEFNSRIMYFLFRFWIEIDLKPTSKCIVKRSICGILKATSKSRLAIVMGRVQNSSGSGRGLAWAFGFGFYRVSIAKKFRVWSGSGSMLKSTFGFGFRPFGFSGFRVSKKMKF